MTDDDYVRCSYRGCERSADSIVHYTEDRQQTYSWWENRQMEPGKSIRAHKYQIALPGVTYD